MSIKNEVYADLSNEDYHAQKDYISRSALMDFNVTPYNYYAKHLKYPRPTREPTPSMIIGSAFHTMILEPHIFDDIYIVEPAKVLLKDVGREMYDDFKTKIAELESSNKIVLKHSDYSVLQDMRERIIADDNAMPLIEGARIEHSFFWQDETSGLLLKTRPDILQPNMILDLKTCADASPRAFQHEMIKYGYHIQFAMIRDAVEIIEGNRINTFINIVIENKYPHNIAIYIIDESTVELGHVKYKQLCLDLKSAIEKNEFPDYGLQKISAPKWAHEEY